MEKILREEKGITLLALVITIVIIIILAGVTINLAIDNSGLVQQSRYAAELTANSIAYEEESMNELMKGFSNIVEQQP